MKIYSTTNGYYIAEANGQSHYFDSIGELYTGDTSLIGSKSKIVRKDSMLYETIGNLLNEQKEKEENLIFLEEIAGYKTFMNKKDFQPYIEIEGEFLPLTPETANKIKTQRKELKAFKSLISKESYNLGDRILMYGPTGTGKTFEFLQAVDKLTLAGKIDKSYICTITEGFEDLDFLAHIVPTPTGISYTENEIVTLLREASEGTKVAILLDELNRGSKSFLNLILKLLDAVDGKNYILNNFVKNEIITIPIENVIFIATMNLGGKYVGTNALDEALFDRFNIVQYKGYNSEVEDQIMDNFGTYKSKVAKALKEIREAHKEGDIRSPISTRGLKMWAEHFINTGGTETELYESFEKCLLNRLTNVDDFGNPNMQEVGIVLDILKK